MSKWSKDSWKNFKIKHIPEYNDKDQLEKALKITKKLIRTRHQTSSENHQKSLKWVLVRY